MARFAISAVSMKTSACEGRRVTPMSDPSNGLKAGSRSPDNLLDPGGPDFMVCVGDMEENASPADTKRRASLCFAAGEESSCSPVLTQNEHLAHRIPSTMSCSPTSSALACAGGEGRPGPCTDALRSTMPGIMAWASSHCICLIDSVIPVTSTQFHRCVFYLSMFQKNKPNEASLPKLCSQLLMHGQQSCSGETQPMTRKTSHLLLFLLTSHAPHLCLPSCCLWFSVAVGM